MSEDTGMFDRWLQGEGEEEQEQTSRGFKPLPEKAWVLFQPAPGDSNLRCGLDLKEGVKDDGTAYRFHQLKLSLIAVGSDGVVDPAKGPYSTYFHRTGIDSKNTPGVPGSAFVAFRNHFLAPGTAHESAERKAAALKAIAAVAREEGLDPAKEESEAVAQAKVLALALGREPRPFIIGRTYMSRPKSIPQKDGSMKEYPAQLTVGDWQDATPEMLEAKGIKLWP